MASKAYKIAQAAFVSNLHGTTVWEIQLVVSMSLAAHFAWKATLKALDWKVPRPLMFGLDFAFLVLPLLLSYTIAWLAPILIASFTVFGLAMVGINWFTHSGSIQNQKSPTPEQRATLVSLAGSRKPFLDVYRSLMMLSTVICILAVDFSVFPRRFAKTETFGTSLMDVGVGSFVLVNSLTAGNSLEQRGNPFTRSLRAAMPLVVLGLIRLASVKGMDYQEHVSEYGVHWNFFFTLALMPVLAILSRGLLKNPSHFSLLGAIVIVGYQLVLSLTPLQIYILEAPRTDIVSANKEGIFSVFGYFAIFAFGIHLGIWLLKHKPLQGWWKSVGYLMAIDVVLWSLWAFCEMILEIKTSRRLANLPYVIWTLAYNLPFLAGFLAIDLFIGFTQPGVIYTAINRNQLAVFLFANVLTGLVNMNIQTLYVLDAPAVLILIGYTLLVCLAAAIADTYDITLKVW